MKKILDVKMYYICKRLFELCVYNYGLAVDIYNGYNGSFHDSWGKIYHYVDIRNYVSDEIDTRNNLDLIQAEIDLINEFYEGCE